MERDRTVETVARAIWEQLYPDDHGWDEAMQQARLAGGVKTFAHTECRKAAHAALAALLRGLVWKQYQNGFGHLTQRKLRNLFRGSTGCIYEYIFTKATPRRRSEVAHG